MGTWWSLPCPFYCTDLDIKFSGVIKVTKDEWYKQLFENLGKSTFRSRFHLKQVDIDYITKREASAVIPNDGKQTPMRGHPVFIAQHATATCCRGCIKKWHKIQPGKQLSQVQQDYLVDVIMTWIRQEMELFQDRLIR